MKDKCCLCFKTISSKSRFRIFQFLKDSKTKRVNVSKLVRLLRLKQPTVSFHLNQLKKRGLVRKYKEGRDVYCQVYKKCSRCPLF